MIPKSFTIKGQLFEFVEVRPYLKKDGTASQIMIWRSNCQVCGSQYEVTSPVVVDRRTFSLNCSAHRRVYKSN